MGAPFFWWSFLRESDLRQTNAIMLWQRWFYTAVYACNLLLYIKRGNFTLSFLMTKCMPNMHHKRKDVTLKVLLFGMEENWQFAFSFPEPAVNLTPYDDDDGSDPNGRSSCYLSITSSPAFVDSNHHHLTHLFTKPPSISSPYLFDGWSVTIKHEFRGSQQTLIMSFYLLSWSDQWIRRSFCLLL